MMDARRTHCGLRALVLAATCVPTLVFALCVQPDSKVVFSAKWSGLVVLKKPPYSIAYGFGSGGGKRSPSSAPTRGPFTKYVSLRTGPTVESVSVSRSRTRSSL